MSFSYYDFDSMREYIAKIPASSSIKKLRLELFGIWRYQEEYEKIYDLLKHFKCIIG